MRWLRIGVPVGIAAILLAVVGINYMPPIGGFRLPGELGNLVIHGTKITMQQPRLTGFTTDSRAYEFSADAAAQDITKPNLVELQELHAKMEMQDKSTVEMSADSGIYDVKTEILTLNDNIELVSSTGYSGHLSEAVIDVRKGNVVSDQPVSVKMLNGFLNAKRLDIVENGSVLRFGSVAMTLQPGKDDRKGRRPMMRRLQLCAVAALAALLTAAPAGCASAACRRAEPVPGHEQNQNQDQPVQIEAATLEVRDKNKTATFSGNVQVVQGDTTMKCQSLVVFYGQEVGLGAGRRDSTPAPTAAKSTPGMPQGAQNIRRIEARGGVTVITKDQNASGDLGIYDLKTKTITLSGNVVVSQGQNVIHGERVVVDTVTGNARVESGSGGSWRRLGHAGPRPRADPARQGPKRRVVEFHDRSGPARRIDRPAQSPSPRKIG